MELILILYAFTFGDEAQLSSNLHIAQRGSSKVMDELWKTIITSDAKCWFEIGLGMYPKWGGHE